MANNTGMNAMSRKPKGRWACGVQAFSGTRGPSNHCKTGACARKGPKLVEDQDRKTLVGALKAVAGRDIGKLVNDPMVEASMDSGTTEWVELLRKLRPVGPEKEQ
eukprot:g9000.t1